METYKNGESGITHYEIGEDFIKIWFKGKPEPYTYADTGPGKPHIDIMKALAVIGRGLATYINQHPTVKDGYERAGTTRPQSIPPRKF